MSNAIKWAILGALVIALIALIVVLPFNDYINVSEFTTSVNGIVTLCGQYFRFGRGLINNFLTPFGRGCVTGLMSYWIAKFFINLSIKVVAWVNHFIFRG